MTICAFTEMGWRICSVDGPGFYAWGAHKFHAATICYICVQHMVSLEKYILSLVIQKLPRCLLYKRPAVCKKVRLTCAAVWFIKK